jgi:RNA polymerase sigma factor (TIGR02999 family)
MSHEPSLGEVTYNQLRRIAAASFRGSNGISLQPTALVHEAWMKVAQHQPEVFANRGHFMSLAARAMRQILIDHVRAKGAQKRGGDRVQVTLTGLRVEETETVVDLLALDAALRELSTLDARRAQVVELKFFAGLTMPEIAEAVDASVATVERDWRGARAWLQVQLGH